LGSVPTVRLFAAAREAAGTGTDVIDGATVDDVLRAAEARYGERFSAVLTTCRVWVNGDDVARDTRIHPSDEVAVLPPVSGGSS
jgi:MoaD family protein